MRYLNVLVTGGAGFVGTNFIRHALTRNQGLRIINLDAVTCAGNPANLSDLSTDMPERYRFVHGDICDGLTLKRLFEEEPIDGVIHFAAESDVDPCVSGPMKFIETNVIGTCRLLEISARHWKLMGKPIGYRFLYVSTSEVYSSLMAEGYGGQNESYDPSNPFSATKAGADHLVQAWYRTYGLPIIITSCSANFGPYQFPNKTIPAMIFNLLESKPLPYIENGSDVHDWVYVIDHCEALLTAFSKGEPGETYHIHGGSVLKNSEVARSICNMLDVRLGRAVGNIGRNSIEHFNVKSGCDYLNTSNSSKIGALGWQSGLSFETALEQTVDWYLNNQEWIDRVRSGAYRKWIHENYLFM